MKKNMILGVGAIVAFTTVQAQSQRPNFVWVMIEDVAADYVSLYNSSAAPSPNAARLAENGVIFQHAYSNAPVSSAARSTLITGCYANRLGVGFHRRIQSVELPSDVEMLPRYLKQNGYYTTNSTKTDYNFTLTPNAWDNSQASAYGWRERSDDAPFFHVLTLVGSHESSLHFKPESAQTKPTRFHPDSVKLAPFHKDTELMRYTYATFFDRITESDAKLGALMEELKTDSLLDNTFVFYFGDNGGALPGTKGYTSELGLRVPLVVYVPAAWREKLDLPLGGRVDGFVSFVDFAPTLLELAGIDLPESLDGKPFLGQDIPLTELNSRDEVYNYGERFDEMYAFTRTLRKGNFKYIRNFQGYGPRSIHTFYRYRMPAFVEWEKLYQQGKLNRNQSQFFTTQGAEELYDLSIDPYELNNLANQSEFATVLKSLRTTLKNKMVSLSDIGFYPECEWISGVASHNNPACFTAQHAKDIARYADLAELGVIGYDAAKDRLVKSLKSSDPVDRYWAVVACCNYNQKAKELRDAVSELFADERGFVRSKAVQFVAQLGDLDVQKQMDDALSIARSDAERLLILNDATFLRDVLGCEYIPTLDNNRTYIEEIGWRLEYLAPAKQTKQFKR